MNNWASRTSPSPDCHFIAKRKARPQARLLDLKRSYLPGFGLGWGAPQLGHPLLGLPPLSPVVVTPMATLATATPKPIRILRNRCEPPAAAP